MTPGLQKRHGLVCNRALQEGVNLLARQQSARNGLPVERRPLLLHIHPQRPAAVEGQENQIPGMADVELRPPAAIGLALWTQGDGHMLGLLIHPESQHLAQHYSAQQKALLILLAAIAAKAALLFCRQSTGQTSQNGSADAITTIHCQEQGLIILMAAIRSSQEFRKGISREPRDGLEECQISCLSHEAGSEASKEQFVKTKRIMPEQRLPALGAMAWNAWLGEASPLFCDHGLTPLILFLTT